VLPAEVVAEEHHVDVRPDRAEPLLDVREVETGEGLGETPTGLRLKGQRGEVGLHPVQHLARLEEVPAEEGHDRPVRRLPEGLRAAGELAEPPLVQVEVSTRVRDRPHDLGEGVLEIGEVVVLDGAIGEGEVDLVEVEAALLLHADRSALVREQVPVVSPALELHVGGDLAGCSVREHPVRPLPGI
jgi:hypothetical protein